MVDRQSYGLDFGREWHVSKMGQQGRHITINSNQGHVWNFPYFLELYGIRRFFDHAENERVKELEGDTVCHAIFDYCLTVGFYDVYRHYYPTSKSAYYSAADYRRALLANAIAQQLRR